MKMKKQSSGYIFFFFLTENFSYSVLDFEFAT